MGALSTSFIRSDVQWSRTYSGSCRTSLIVVPESGCGSDSVAVAAVRQAATATRAARATATAQRLGPRSVAVVSVRASGHAPCAAGPRRAAADYRASVPRRLLHTGIDRAPLT